MMWILHYFSEFVHALCRLHSQTHTFLPLSCTIKLPAGGSGFISVTPVLSNVPLLLWFTPGAVSVSGLLLLDTAAWNGWKYLCVCRCSTCQVPIKSLFSSFLMLRLRAATSGPHESTALNERNQFQFKHDFSTLVVIPYWYSERSQQKHRAASAGIWNFTSETLFMWTLWTF